MQPQNWVSSPQSERSSFSGYNLFNEQRPQLKLIILHFSWALRCCSDRIRWFHKLCLSWWSSLSDAPLLYFLCSHSIWVDWGFFSFDLWKLSSKLIQWLAALEDVTFIYSNWLLSFLSLCSTFKNFMHLIVLATIIHLNLIRNIVHKNAPRLLPVCSIGIMWIAIILETPTFIPNLCIIQGWGSKLLCLLFKLGIHF